MPATTVETLIYKIKVDDGGAFSAWEKRLESIKHKSKAAFDAIANSAKGIKGSFNPLTAALDLFKNAFKGVIDLIGKGLKELGQFTVRFVKDSMTAYMSYEEALYNVSKTTGLVGDDLKLLADEIKRTAKPLGSLTAENLLEVAEVAGQLGIKGVENIRKFSEQIGIGTIVLDKYGGSTEKLGGHIAKMQNVFGLAVKDTAAMISVLYQLKTTTSATELDISNFNLQMGQFNALMRLSFEQSSTWGAMFADVGVKASKGATQIGSAFTTVTTNMDKLYAASQLLVAGLGSQEAAWRELEGLTGKTRDQFANMSEAMLMAFSESSFQTMNLMALAIGNVGITTENLEKGINRNQLAVDAFGKVGLKGMAALGEAMRKSEADLEKVQMAFQDANHHMTAYERLTKRAGEQWKVLDSVMNSIMLTVGEPLVNAFGNFIQEAILPVLNEFDEWLVKSDLMKEIVPRVLSDISDALKNVLNWAVRVVKKLDWNAIIAKVYEWYQKLIKSLKEYDWVGLWEDVKEALKELGPALIEIKDAVIETGEAVRITVKAASQYYKDWNAGIEILGQGIDKYIIAPFQKLGLILENLATDFVRLIGSITGITEAVKLLGKVSHGESVFPDMQSWANKAAVAVENIGKASERVIPKMVGLNPQGSVEGLTPSYAGASGSRSRGGSSSSGRREGVTNIIFQGQNIVDESSKNRFARNVSQRQYGLGARVIRSDA